jgi:hypothetical protein
VAWFTVSSTGTKEPGEVFTAKDEAGKREALRAIGQAVLEGERRRTDA